MENDIRKIVGNEERKRFSWFKLLLILELSYLFVVLLLSIVVARFLNPEESWEFLAVVQIAAISSVCGAALTHYLFSRIRNTLKGDGVTKPQ